MRLLMVVFIFNLISLNLLASENCPQIPRFVINLPCQLGTADSTWYHPNGTRANYGDTWYHENGTRANYGDTWYHANGNRANYGDTWYHANGTRANYGDTWYDENGNRVNN